MIISEVKFQKFLKMDIFKNSKIAKSLASAPPKLEDRDSVPKNDQELTPDEIQKMKDDPMEQLAWSKEQLDSIESKT